MKGLALVVLAACGGSSVIHGQQATPLPVHPSTSIDLGPPVARARMLPPEAFLRAYLQWFGGLAPAEVQKRGGPLFGRWEDYLAALGLPNYAYEFPRVSQTNTLMVASLDRLAEALCVRAAEHDLHQQPPLDQRVVFAFASRPQWAFGDFVTDLDVLHRTFLGYPLQLAPEGRAGRFYALFEQVRSNHAQVAAPLTADEMAWVAVCKALVVHPEAEIY